MPYKKDILSFDKIQALRNLKVIRSDNDDLKILLDSYLRLVTSLDDLEKTNEMIAADLEDYHIDNKALRDEISFLKKEYTEMDTQNRSFNRIIKKVITVLEQEKMVNLTDQEDPPQDENPLNGLGI